MKSRDYKRIADKLLAVNNRKSDFVKITLVFFIISAGVTALVPPLTPLVVTPLISLIFARTARKVYCDKDIPVGDAFSDFSKALDTILFTLISTVLITLGMILFFIPGIIIAITLSIGYFILADDPDASFSDALRKSREMMKGHRWQLFKLNFSFFGWYLLVPLTLGIYSFWLVPRVQMANMVFYANLKKELYGEDVSDEKAAPFSDSFNSAEYTPASSFYTAPSCDSEPAVENTVAEPSVTTEAAPVIPELTAEDFENTPDENEGIFEL